LEIPITWKSKRTQYNTMALSPARWSRQKQKKKIIRTTDNDP